MKPLQRQQAGLTLIELIMTVVIISVAIAGVVGAFSLIAGRSADPLWQTRSIGLGQAYLDEILAKKFDEATQPGGVPAYSGSCNIGADTGETGRGQFDDVDDYHGLTDHPPTLVNEDLDAAYDDYQVAITVQCAGDDVGVADNMAKRIDVTITPPRQSGMTFSAYKGNY